MIARSSGRGSPSWTKSLSLIGGGLLGGIVTAVVLATVSKFVHPSGMVVAIASVALMAWYLLGSSTRLPGSTWTIPRGLSSLGPVGFFAAFGFFLGTGFATAVPAIGYYLLVIWALAEGSSQAVLLVFALFALTRSVGAAMVAAMARDPLHGISRAQSLGVAASYLQALPMAALAVWLWIGSI